ncbi:MAG: SAM-dependent methyltransferase [Clostridia bacterium]|nr:SAM-dependent methyltransferase [Clostridia bacterium]
MITEDIKNALLPIHGASIIKLTLSNPKSALEEYKKITARKADKLFLVEKFTEKQAFHEKLDEGSLIGFLEKQLSESFRQLNLQAEGFDFELKISKKGKILTNKSKNDLSLSAENVGSHNRKKNYILEEGIFVPALYELGVMTKEGKIVAQKYDKFKQINRFVECVDDALKNDESDKTLEIVDFGCGKSYLTFVLYYYMTKIKGRKVRVTGLDLKKDVIEKCNEVAKKYGYSEMTFLCGDIKDYKPKTPPDMVVTLHACDTATDFALYNAILWESRYIFSVPCCQHELNTNIKSGAFGILTSYGLIKERMCALATDAQRAKILELCGYKTDILEFIDMDNSPKNLLIRAKRTKFPNEFKRKTILSEISDFAKESGCELTLFNLLKEKL